MIAIDEPENTFLGRLNVQLTKEDYRWAYSRNQAYVLFARAHPNNEILEVREVIEPEILQERLFQ